jgi:transcription-repair coupling factor (superfamily II helicase)
VVTSYDEEEIRRAILREMERGGQVYFVHNRVRGIEQIARRLGRIVPEARLAIGHGQMAEQQLARVMRDFVSQQLDVLVCTSIIESGLDIPNVNTIIINRADRFGLAQLYQLRGRVGRGANRAYAYLMYDRSGGLSDVARRRLQAIFEADELGSGFRVAMHDMEIRGVGDILGSRQHGQISAIGFDLYCRLLSRAIQERQKGKKQGAPEEVAPSLPAVELPLEAHLPESYVTDGSARLKLYRRMAQQDTVEGVADIAEEIRDRFGEFPSPVENLLYVLRLRALAARGGLRSISLEGQRVVVRSNGRARAAWNLLPRELVYVGREKVHLSVDLRTPEGRRDLLKLLEKAILSYDGVERRP